MTEYEIIELSLTWIERSENSSFTYFTVISAYLVAAYTVGRDLSTRQVFTISVLFVAFAGAPTIGMVAQLQNLLNLAYLRQSAYPDSAIPTSIEAIKGGYFWVLIQAAGILVAIKFMWDIRHPRADSSL